MFNRPPVPPTVLTSDEVKKASTLDCVPSTRKTPPSSTVNEPVNEFTPESVNVPEPFLTNPPVPEMAPAKVVLVESPTVSTPVPNVTCEVESVAASEATRSLEPFRSNRPLEPMVTADVSAI